jgi:collagen triple helix repeat protein
MTSNLDQGSRAMLATGISSLSRLGLFVPLALSACGGADTVTLDGVAQEDAAAERATASLGIATLEYRSALPSCGKTNQGQVYYVSREDQLYVCDGGGYYELDLDLDPSWLTDTIGASSAACSNGGTTIRSGPDYDDDHRLDSWEIESTGTVCNGKDGKNGVNGKDGQTGATGPQGPAGASGTNGETGATGAAGVAGPAGTSCTVQDNGDDTKTLSCEDGTLLTIHDGSSGATGAQGPAGADGQDGATGAQGVPGEAGTSCRIMNRGSNAYLVGCLRGATIVPNGSDGQDGTSAPALVNVTTEPRGSHCHAGGHLIELGYDIDHSGVLEPGEVTDRDYACAPPTTFLGNVRVLSDADLEQLLGVGTIDGDLLIRGSVTDAALQEAASDLRFARSLTISGTSVLTSFALDLNVPSTATVSIDHNAALTHFSLDGISDVNNLNIVANGALTGFRIAQLSSVGSFLRINTNPVLADLDGLPALTAVSRLVIGGNVSLPTCQAVLLRDRLSPAPVSSEISGNDDDGACP